MRLAWCDYGETIPGMYRIMGAHLRAALIASGKDIVDTRPGYPCQPHDILHFAPTEATAAWLRPGKTNWVFPLFEIAENPPKFLPKNVRLLVPSTYCQMVLAKRGIESNRIPVGVDPIFLRTDPGRVGLAGHCVRFLWFHFGLQAEFNLLRGAWQDAFSSIGGLINGANVSLRIKTVGEDNTVSEGEMAGKPIFADSRRLEPEAIADLFASHDVFIGSGSMGSLSPTIDAMATGCLSIQPLARSLVGDLTTPATALIPGNPKELSNALAQAAREWGTPRIESIRRAGIERARMFTWEETAKCLLLTIADGEASRPKIMEIQDEARIEDATDRALDDRADSALTLSGGES